MAVSNGIDVSQADALAQIILSRPTDGRWLDAAHRAGFLAALSALGPDVSAVFVRSSDRIMAAHQDLGPDLPGADDAVAPTLTTLCQAVAGSAKPVVMLLEGVVAGAAADLSLAAAARIATPGARLAFGAARLGRISGAGSTQRLPRLVGAEPALRLLTGGKPIAAPEALVIGLVDQIVEGESASDVLDAARHWVHNHLAALQRPLGVADGRAYLSAVKAARQSAAPGSLAMALADCAEAALLLPPDQGMAFEAALAQERDALPQTAALAHLVRAERAAAKTPEPLLAVKAKPVSRPALVGASPQMSALALMALARGLPVTVCEPDRGRLVGLLQNIAARQEAAVQAGTLSAVQRDADWARLRPIADPRELDQADLVIVAADTPVPDVSASVPLLMMGRAELPKGALRLVVSGRVAELGLPANCPATPAALALGFLRRIGQTVVLTGVQSSAGISGRLAGAGGAALRAMVGMGVAPEAITAALKDFGFAAPNLPSPDPASRLRLMAPDEIVNRWLGALANEGARVLSAGLALSASDVDLVAIHGLGFLPESGGPLHQADQRGLLILRRDLHQWGAEADVWKPVAALDALVSVGRGFSGSLSRG